MKDTGNILVISDYIATLSMTDNLATYDPYDVWKTHPGVKIKKFYYNNPVLGLIPAAVVTLYDYLNNSLRLGYQKQEYPIVRAQAALTLLALYEKSSDQICLDFVVKHLDWLVEHSSIGYGGYCWGINFVWASKNGVYPKNMPHVTHTPYALEAMVKYELLTGDNRYHEVVTSVYEFLEKDILVMLEDCNQLAMSYAPVSEPRLVINANSYIMYMYSILLSYFPDKKLYISSKIKRIYNFIIAQQGSNGSWYYYADELSGNFIDCFHSAFVIKNIFKTNLIIELDNSNVVIKNGFKYILENFYDNDKKLFKRFSVADKPNYIAYDLYDNAEMLSLMKILKDKKYVDELSDSISENFISGNDVYSKITKHNLLIDKNMLRWAVMPYLLALSEK